MIESPKTAFLVEDESLLLMMLEQTMMDLGYEVGATASSVAGGLEALAGPARYDVAVLDVNLAGDQSFPLARKLLERRIPVVFVTGYGRRGIPEEFGDCPVLQKPYTTAIMERALRELA